jgi:hypothetical protein
MTLSVDAYVRDPDGRMTFVEGPAGSDLAGFERTRYDLWGSSCVVGLGATLLPTLASTNIDAPPSELDDLDRDCVLIADNLAHVATETGFDEDYIAYRLGNIRAAIVRARGVDGGSVVIW